jgi:hypothetical protein
MPEDANRAIINQTLAQANASKPVVPQTPPEPLTPIQAGGPPDLFQPETSKPNARVALPPPDWIPGEMGGTPAAPTWTPGEMAALESHAEPPPDWTPGEMPREPLSHTESIQAIASQYGNDVDAIAHGFYNHEVEDPDLALKAIMHARELNDAKYAGMSGFEADWSRTMDDARNAWNWAGKVINGGWNTAVGLLQVPGQVTGTVENVGHAIAPSREGENQLQTLPGPQPASAVAQGPLGTGPDIVTGGQGTGGLTPADLTSQWKEDMQQQLTAKSQAAERAAVVGTEQGLGGLSDWTFNAISGLIGLVAYAPNQALKLLGGPQIGYIDPKVQLLLATSKTPWGPALPIMSTQSYNDMDSNAIAANLITGRVLAGRQAQTSAGYGSPMSEGVMNILNAFTGNSTMTPEQLVAAGHPVPIKALQDTAATANLAGGYFAFGLLGRLMDAAGLTSVANVATNKILEGTANRLEDFAANITEPRPIVSNVVSQVAKRAAGSWTAQALLGQTLGPWAPIIGGMVKLPFGADEAVTNLVKFGAGGIPKAIAAVSRQAADALQLAASDPENLLATRSPLKQLLILGIRNTAQGITGVAPAFLGAKSPEEVGGLLTTGAALGALHAPVDVFNVARNQIGDATFITDFNRFKNREPASKGIGRWDHRERKRKRSA